MNIEIIITSIILFFLLIVFVLYYRNYDVNAKKITKQAPNIKMFEPKFNCQEIITPCFTNKNCSALCSNDMYTCDSDTKVCVSTDDGSNVPPDDDDDNGNNLTCNEKHGILKILTYDSVLGTSKFVCKSVIIPYIFNDQDEQTEYCKDGTFDINIIEQDVNPENCICKYNLTWFINELNIPMCVSINHAIPELFLDDRIYNNEKNKSKIQSLLLSYTQKRLNATATGIDDGNIENYKSHSALGEFLYLG